MAIGFGEVTIASKNIDRLQNFYAQLIDHSDTTHHEFFYTVKDPLSKGQLAIVPHNGDETWNEPWITLVTDDMTSALQKIKQVGVPEEQIEPFSAQDPDGRRVMMFSKPRYRPGFLSPSGNHLQTPKIDELSLSGYSVVQPRQAFRRRWFFV